ncbi:hypothetical protein [Neisseria meningitidis]|uniref:hypothetical protein n=5 Tax=Neisseria meningitidis TaxID=487 RepID=UPI0002F634C8|nr:hypothetical protein [Neisseria meningitidis]
MQERSYATAYWPFSVRESCTSNANPPNVKNWTTKEVKQSLDKFNNILIKNTFLLQYLKKEFSASSAYCLSMLPEEEDIYEILVNGNIIIDLEFNKHTNETVVINVTDVDEYLKTLTNESGRVFFTLAKEIGKQKNI